jgi:hypothetical protein
MQIPEDYKLVPIEPTEKMLESARLVMASWYDIPGSGLTVAREKMKMRYQAMLKAAPKIELEILPIVEYDEEY